MPFYEGQFFETDEKLLEYLKKKAVPKVPPALRLYEGVEDYLKEIKVTGEEKRLTWLEAAKVGLLNKVSTFFVDMWENVWVTLRKALGGIVADVFTLFFKQITTVATPGIKEWITKRIEDSELPKPSKDSLVLQLAEATPLDYLWVFLFTVFANMGTLASLLSAGYEVGRQTGYKTLQPSLPGLGDIFTARFRDPTYEAVIDDYMLRMGYNKDVREMLKVVSWSLMGAGEIKELYLRGEITLAERDKRLKMLGLKSDDLPLLEKLYYFIPSPTDLVSMAVREAWDDEFARKWGTDLDFPAPFLEWAKKQGMSEYWVRKFWRAHWVLPSIMQGFEMLHRGKISWEDLKGLLKALDVMPGWREKLLAISYAPYTRVDVRRMYGAGVLKKEDVMRTYLDLGYDEEHARNLTTFTIKDALADEKDFTKGEVLSLYERKIIKRESAKEMITSLGYTKEEAEIYLDKSDYDVAKKLKDKTLSFVEKNYIAGLIDSSEAHNRLSRLNLGGDEISQLFKDWDIEKEGKMADLTFPQLQTLLIQGIITEDIFKNELKSKNYTDQQIDWLTKLTRKKVVQA